MLNFVKYSMKFGRVGGGNIYIYIYIDEIEFICYFNIWPWCLSAFSENFKKYKECFEDFEYISCPFSSCFGYLIPQAFNRLKNIGGYLYKQISHHIIITYMVCWLGISFFLSLLIGTSSQPYNCELYNSSECNFKGQQCC